MNLYQCRYSKGIKGHPKVTIKQNPASVNRFQRRISRECKKKCDNEKSCEVYAVNKENQLCHTFTYEDLDQKKILWEQHNKNMKWVSKTTNIMHFHIVNYSLLTLHYS